jgi:hypothetical protein
MFGNLGTVVSQSVHNHIVTPTKKGNPVKAILLGTVGVVGDTIFRGPDALAASVAGEELEPLEPVSLARIRSDSQSIISNTKDAFLNLVTLHPIEAGKSVLKDGLALVRLAGDVPMDTLDTVAGFNEREDHLSISA